MSAVQSLKESGLKATLPRRKILELFEGSKVRHLSAEDVCKALFELNQGGHHDHLVCLQCGRVEEFYDPDIEKRQNEVARQRGFQLHAHSLALYADCTKRGCPYRPA